MNLNKKGMSQDLNEEKSVAKSSFDETQVEEGVIVIAYKNEDDDMQSARWSL